MYSVGYLEDCKHHAAKRSVIGELSHTEYIKAPLIQVVQLLPLQKQTNKYTSLRQYHNSPLSPDPHELVPRTDLHTYDYRIYSRLRERYRNIDKRETIVRCLHNSVSSQS